MPVLALVRHAFVHIALTDRIDGFGPCIMKREADNVVLTDLFNFEVLAGKFKRN